ncbi:DUF1345 domain-containing protein [Qipengyuania sp.]|uniref:DUF1345 domain-containing protein n=1 Tax=Qipengyuania sp. TaxID=2004515 RepID=UPI0035C84D5B
MAGRGGIGNRLAPARFVLFLALLAGGFGVYHFVLRLGPWTDAIAMAFDFAALVFLASLIPLFRDCDAAEMRDHAQRNDANRLLILALTSLLTVTVMAAITGELDGAQKGDLVSVVKLVGTLTLIWLFANAVYALHYAHVFYSRDDDGDADHGGLSFPETAQPGYWDFAYFAYTLGMTFQTSDVEMTRSSVRKVALMHSFAAFLFNIGVIAFTVNVLGGSS